MIIDQIDEMRNVLSGLSNGIGTDESEAIERANADLIILSEWLGSIRAEFDQMVNDIERLNKRCQGLQVSNNQYLRQINFAEEAAEEANSSEPAPSERFRGLFDI